MNYQDLIETISLIVETEKINKKGLTLVYELDDESYNELNKTLFYKSNPYSVQFVPTDEFEAMIGGILIKFTKLKL
jgi:hypothetical protein